MVIFPNRKMVFVHIPRTSGMALSHAIGEVCPDALVDLSPVHIHDRAERIRKWAAAPEWKLFTIMRNPFQLFESHYRWCLMLKANDFPNSESYVREYVDWIIEKGFQAGIHRAINRQMVTPCGFFEHFCDESTRVFQYADEPYDAIGDMLGVKLKMQHINSIPTEPLEWSKELVGMVRELCADDFRRFGYCDPTLYKRGKPVIPKGRRKG